MRLRLSLLLSAFVVGCASTPPPPATPPAPPAPPPPPQVRPLSPEAAAVFARAEAPGPGGAFFVNMDALEALGLTSKGVSLHELARVTTAVLAQLAGDESSDTRFVAQSAVASALVRDWAKWPGARRFAILLPSDRALEQGPGVIAEEMVGALAVDEGSPDNPELLAGLGALLRTVAEDLGSGTDVRVVTRGQDLCLEGKDVHIPLCIRPRPGLMLLGTPTALSAVEALPPVVVPAAAPAQAPVLMAMRANLGAEGRGRMTFSGRDAVLLRLDLEGLPPKNLSVVEQGVKKGLAEYDAHQARMRERITAGLAEVQRSLAKDPTSPASLKQAATTLSVEKVVDERGYWAQTRQSVQTSATQNGFTLSLTVPEGAVKDFSTQLSQGGGAVALLGIASAVALPDFFKKQSRSRQAEVKANLRVAYIAQRSFMAEKDRWGRSFQEIGFTPEKGRRYTYCMGKQCLPCDLEGCKVSPPPSPCEGLTKVGKKEQDGFSICAYGNLDEDDTWDVWVTREDGELLNPSNDLE